MRLVEVASAASVALIGAAPERSADAAFERAWARVRDGSLLDAFRARRLWDLACEASALPGDLVECGAYRGGTAALLGLLVVELGLPKRVYALDSFAGMPSPDPAYDRAHLREGVLAAELEEVRARIHALGLDDVVVLVPGWFQDTLPALPSETFSLVHIDCDLYASTKVCLEALYPRLTDGGPLVFDDYLIRSPGERVAAQELVARTGDTLELGPVTQAYLRKGRCHTPHLRIADPEGVSLSCDDLVADAAYLAWLEELAVDLHARAADVAELALTFR